MKKQLYRAAAATVLGLSLTTGVVAADTGNIDTTGPNSDNRISTRISNRTHVHNNNDIHVHNDNDQRAYSGDARVSGNTHGGDAETGDARNSNSTNVEVDVDNSASTGNIDPSNNWGGGFGGGGGSISDTGPNSDNSIKTRVNNSVSINNDNDISISNDNDQHASSGDARVSGNTFGGDATSGDASNTNSSTFSISVTN